MNNKKIVKILVLMSILSFGILNDSIMTYASEAEYSSNAQTSFYGHYEYPNVVEDNDNKQTLVVPDRGKNNISLGQLENKNKRYPKTNDTSSSYVENLGLGLIFFVLLLLFKKKGSTT